MNCKTFRLHGNMNNEERRTTFHSFKTEKSALLLSSDVAARGLDFPKVRCIIQYDSPGDATEYVHRFVYTFYCMLVLIFQWRCYWEISLSLFHVFLSASCHAIVQFPKFVAWMHYMLVVCVDSCCSSLLYCTISSCVFYFHLHSCEFFVLFYRCLEPAVGNSRVIGIEIKFKKYKDD